MITSPLEDEAGIAAAREHDGHRGLGDHSSRDPGEPAGLCRRLEQLEQIRPQPRQDRLRLGIAEADVELEHLRAVGGQHQPGVEDAVERHAAPGELVEHGLMDGAPSSRGAPSSIAGTGE